MKVLLLVSSLAFFGSLHLLPLPCLDEQDATTCFEFAILPVSTINKHVDALHRVRFDIGNKWLHFEKFSKKMAVLLGFVVVSPVSHIN